MINSTFETVSVQIFALMARVKVNFKYNGDQSI
jgi:hypothetical protein